MLRRISDQLVSKGISGAPKRPVQTPQREWLRGELNEWSTGMIENSLSGFAGAWFDTKAVKAAWRGFSDGNGDNSFFVWQWITPGLMREQRNVAFAT